MYVYAKFVGSARNVNQAKWRTYPLVWLTVRRLNMPIAGGSYLIGKLENDELTHFEGAAVQIPDDRHAEIVPKLAEIGWSFGANKFVRGVMPEWRNPFAWVVAPAEDVAARMAYDAGYSILAW